MDSKNYSNILQFLNDGYVAKDLQSLGIKKEEIYDFVNFLEEKNLTVENAMALNMYSNDSSMILGIKKGVVSKEDLLKNISLDTSSLLAERNVSNSNISNIFKFIESLDYFEPLYENYKKTKIFLEENNMPKGLFPTINTCIKKVDMVARIDSIINEIDDALNKSELNESITLYRGLKLSNEQINSLKSQENVENLGYTSTATTYESSFAKYDDYKVVFKMHCNEGTKGIAISPFSDYGSCEDEVLLAPNTFEISKINESNGKIVFDGNVLGNELSVGMEH